MSATVSKQSVLLKKLEIHPERRRGGVPGLEERPEFPHCHSICSSQPALIPLHASLEAEDSG